VALPAAVEEMAPVFAHHAAIEFPRIEDDGMTLRLVLGALHGKRSPVATTSDTIFADVALKPGAKMPLEAAHEERAIYVVDGEIDISGDRFSAGRLLVFRPSDRITVAAVTQAHIVILGGAAMDGPRHIWWNFVSSRKERIEAAKADWQAGHFDKVPGDELEFIPAPA
jgi:redox-sensitive bicupin YhaK (pirin superfamily)